MISRCRGRETCPVQKIKDRIKDEEWRNQDPNSATALFIPSFVLFSTVHTATIATSHLIGGWAAPESNHRDAEFKGMRDEECRQQ